MRGDRPRTRPAIGPVLGVWLAAALAVALPSVAAPVSPAHPVASAPRAGPATTDPSAPLEQALPPIRSGQGNVVGRTSEHGALPPAVESSVPVLTFARSDAPVRRRDPSPLTPLRVLLCSWQI